MSPQAQETKLGSDFVYDFNIEASSMELFQEAATKQANECQRLARPILAKLIIDEGVNCSNGFIKTFSPTAINGISSPSDILVRKSLAESPLVLAPVACVPVPAAPVVTADINDKYIFQVQFKHMYRDCAAMSGTCAPIEVGSFVIVECEHKGNGLGVVTSKWTAEEFAVHRSAQGPSKDSEENTSVPPNSQISEHVIASRISIEPVIP
eukprot:gene31353-38729_t